LLAISDACGHFRCRATADGFSALFGDHITVDLRPGGMHLIARFTSGVSDVKLADLAQAGGLSVEALSRRATTQACGQGLLLGFTNIAEADTLAVCHHLHRLIGKSSDNETRKRPAAERQP